ncbi:MAG: hypothetical protein WAO02_00030 [Verrucomicrobiia bacterium]
MKPKSPSRKQRDLAARRAWYRRCIVVGAMLLSCGATARAGDTNAPALTPEQMFEGGAKSYDNWVELGVGDLFTSGSQAQAQQQYQLSNDPFGGVSDLHLQKDVTKGTTFTMDGHSLFDQNDYKVTLGLQREDFGYIKFNVTDFRTWYNGAGGFYNGTQYPLLPNNALYLDRGTISVEAGLTPKDLPQVIFKYTHSYRDGDKSSTIWGPVHTDGMTRNVYPSFYNIDEKVDSYALDLTHHIKTTDFGAGVRYETATLNDAHLETLYYGDGAPVQQSVTDSQGTSYDMFNVHAFSETWLKKNLFFSTGYSFADLHDTFSGSRIYGDDYNVGYTPNPGNGLGYTSLNGGANEQTHVGNVNLMAIPAKNLTIVPSLRVESDTWNANSSGNGTFSTDTQPYSGNGNGEMLDVREGLDVRYTGVTNWVFSCGGEWTEGSGNLYQANGLYTVNGSPGPPPVLALTDETRWFQKYSIGARWYPLRRVIVDAGAYYKRNEYDYNIVQDSTPNYPSSGNTYPAFLTMQRLETTDGNVRLTLRPIQNVVLVSRYEYQYSTIDTAPDPVPDPNNNGQVLGQTQSSIMTSQIFAQNASWTPWSRLCLQAGFNYVVSETKTPASSIVPTGLSAAPILNAQNNYWTVTFDSTLVVDDKTDLNLGFIYYQASDYNNNSSVGLPLGAGADEQTLTASLTRRITQNLRVSLKYAYTHYNDWASGGFNNYDAQMVYSSLQYRF